MTTCLKCGSPQIKAKMLLFNSTFVGATPMMSATALQLAGRPVQPLWAFLVTGIGSLAIGAMVGLATNWEATALFLPTFAIGAVVLLWPLTPWRKKAVQRWEEHLVWLDRTWICSACGETTQE